MSKIYDDEDEYDEIEYIEPIDTRIPVKKTPVDLQRAIVNLQVKMNEIIETLNLIMEPEDEFDEDDIIIADEDYDDDEEEGEVESEDNNSNYAKVNRKPQKFN